MGSTHSLIALPLGCPISEGSSAVGGMASTAMKILLVCCYVHALLQLVNCGHGGIVQSSNGEALIQP